MYTVNGSAYHLAIMKNRVHRVHCPLLHEGAGMHPADETVGNDEDPEDQDDGGKKKPARTDFDVGGDDRE